MEQVVVFSEPCRLQDDEGLAEFCCGVDVVDAWVHTQASRAQRRGCAVPYVVRAGNAVAGLYSLSAHSVERSDAHGWLRRNTPDPIPVLLLGIFGVDRCYQGLGLGSSLLSDAIRRAQDAAGMIGARALLVDPATEEARAFYVRYGFRPLEGTERLFLPLART